MRTITGRRNMSWRATVCSMAVGIVMAVLFGLGSAARAQSSAGLAIDDSPTAMIALGALDLLNLGTAVANTYAIATNERMVTVAVVSYVGSVGGAIASGIAYAGSNDTGVKVMGATSFGLAVVNAALATWNLTRPNQEVQRLVFVPASMADSGGNAAAGLAMAGLF